jgi:hypothetical protein
VALFSIIKWPYFQLTKARQEAVFCSGEICQNGGESLMATTHSRPHVGEADSAGCGQGGTSNLKPGEHADKGRPYPDPRPLA